MFSLEKTQGRQDSYFVYLKDFSCGGSIKCVLFGLRELYQQQWGGNCKANQLKLDVLSFLSKRWWILYSQRSSRTCKPSPCRVCYNGDSFHLSSIRWTPRSVSTLGFCDCVILSTFFFHSTLDSFINSMTNSVSREVGR